MHILLHIYKTISLLKGKERKKNPKRISTHKCGTLPFLKTFQEFYWNSHTRISLPDVTKIYSCFSFKHENIGDTSIQTHQK